MSQSASRLDNILRKCVEEYGLNLDSLTVLTEAASGAYLYTPVLAALAGAKKVYAFSEDSRFGTKEVIRQQTLEAAERLGVEKIIDVIFSKTKPIVGACDIITNSGFVRPITREMVSWMKPTAVIPLMWEPWEFRDADLDFRACQESRILVMGTDESQPPLSMYSCGFYLAMKLLFELGLEGYKTRTLLLGGGNGLGKSIYQRFKQLEMDIAWFAKDEPHVRVFDDLPQHFSAHGSEYDLILVAEHEHDICLLGENGYLSYSQIREANPAMCIGIISGIVDIDGLQNSGLQYYPKRIQPFRYMSYQPYDLGPRPVLELYAAGLKVGQAMARARLAGATVEQAAAIAIENSAAMDFEGDKAWRRVSA
jgi:hypothetical protein